MSVYYVEVDGLTVYSTQSRNVAIEALADAKAHWPGSKDFRITVIPCYRCDDSDGSERE